MLTTDQLLKEREHLLTEIQKLQGMNRRSFIFEDAGGSENRAIRYTEVDGWQDDIQKAKDFNPFLSVFRDVFSIPQNELPGQRPPKSPTSYQDEDTPFGLIKSGKKTRERINAECVKILDEVKNPEDLTREQIATLKQYSGRGGTDEGSYFEYYTTTPVAEGVWDMMKSHGFENGNVLEPATGAGVFLATKPKGVLMSGSELSPISSKVAALLHPEDKVEHKSFEELVMETPDDHFDGCVTNVPFGSERGKTLHLDPEYKNVKQLDQYFISRIIDKIKPGGLACIVCPEATVGRDTDKARYKEWRRTISKKAEFLGAHKFPTGTFSKYGTSAVIDVVVFKKHPQSLLEKIDDLPFETLQAANVIWEPFIKGKYWKTPEGKKTIMGKYIPAGINPKSGKKNRSMVKGKVDDGAMRQNLAKRFHSRIDWAMLDVAEPIQKTYRDGDRRYINGSEHSMDNGVWVKIQKESPIDKKNLDAEKFGAGSFDELEAVLATSTGALTMSSEQMFNVFKTFPDLLTPVQRDAVKFAKSQPKEEIAEQLYRGSIIGGMMAKYSNGANSKDMDDSERQGLLDLVVSEIDKYGHPKNNKNLTITGASSKMFGLFMNAIDENGVPSDLLAGTFEKGSKLQFDSTNPQSIVEHLFHREGFRYVELDELKRLYTGKQKIETLGDVANMDGLAITPEGTLMPLDRYTSGDVYPKIRAMSEAIATETDERVKDKYQKQISEIARKRKDVDINDVSFSMQQRWLPKKYLIEFLHEQGYDAQYGYWEDYEEEDSYSGEKVKKKRWVEDHETPFGEFSGIGGSGFSNYFEKYLNGKKMSGHDQETIIENKNQLKTLTDAFNVYMKSHPDVQEITEIYNEKFLGFIPFEYEEDDLNLDIAPVFKLHGYQNAAIRRFSEEGRGCIGLDVGLGKTITALGLAEYNRNMGRSKRACIVVPKAVLGNWYQESKAFLGHHNNVFFVGFEPKRDKDGEIVKEIVRDEKGDPKYDRANNVQYQDILKEDSPAEIFSKMWQIPQTNFSMVIMTKEKFEEIPLKPSTVDKYAKKMIERSLISEKSGMAAVDKAQDAKKSYGDHEKDLAREGKFYDTGKEKKNQLPFFEDMGFDSVMVDEAHEFKNLYTPQSEKNIAYLSEAGTAKRSIDMALKTNHIRTMNDGRGCYQLTATPVTNSPFEIYNMLSYTVGFEEFEKQDIYTVDDFIRQFGRVESVVKAGLDGSVKSVDGLTGFKNLSGLRNLFHKHVLLKTAKDYPDQIQLPPHEDIDESVYLTDEQQQVYTELRAEAKDAIKKRKAGAIFTVLRKMDRVTTDLDLYYQQMTFVFLGKYAEQVKALLDSVPKNKKVKRPEESDDSTAEMNERRKMITVELPFTPDIIKSDGTVLFKSGKSAITKEDIAGVNIVVPKNDTFSVIVPEDFEKEITNRFKEHKIPVEDVSHPITPKYAKLIENLKAHYEAQGKQIVFTEEKSQHEKIWRIVSHHIPIARGQVGIINAETAGGKKLQEISDNYNSGQFKIVIANRKAEVGVNLQKGTTAIHHLTFPWTPASIQQRNGRGLRQGNNAKNIKIYYYQGRNSIDEYRLDLLQGKSNWIDKLFFGDENEVDNEDANNDGDAAIMLAEDKEEAKRLIMEQREKKIAEEKASRRKMLANTLQIIASTKAAIDAMEERREAEKTRLKERLEEAREKLKGYRDTLTGGDLTEAQIEKLPRLISRKEKEIQDFDRKLKSVDARYDEKKEKQQRLVKQKTEYLRAEAKKGALPFDESLLDHPEKAAVSLLGRVVATGNMYEVNDDSVRYDGSIFKVTSVNPEARTMRIEYIIEKGGRYYGSGMKAGEDIAISRIDSQTKFTRVSYSEKELSLKNLFSEPYSYVEIAEMAQKGKIDKATFYENIAQIRFSTTYKSFIFRGLNLPGEKKGSVTFIRGKLLDEFLNDPDKRSKIAFPEPNDEGFRRAACVEYLEFKRSGNVASEHRDIMQALFGAEFDSIAAKYGETISEKEILEKCVQTWDSHWKQYREQNPNVKLSDPLIEYKIFNEERYDLTNALNKILSLGDNREEILSVSNRFLRGKTEELKEKAAIRNRQIEAEELEAVKNDPNYKEVAPHIAAAFEDIKIKAMYNMTSAVVDFSTKRGVKIEPFERLFLHDNGGYEGRLKQVKDILKDRYSAKFHKGDSGDFSGAWWHVSADTNIEDIYKLIA